MFKSLLLILFLLPLFAGAQYSVSGRVVDAASKQPVADASIFLSNASAGTKANKDGTFTMQNVRGGQYTLIVSVIGYATYQQTIMVNKNLALGDISIIQQSIQLAEVKIGPKRNWARDYERFKSVFLGNTENSKQCIILNPHVLDFDSEDGKFTATAVGFMEIENRALGYHIKYMLTTFTDDRHTGMSYFAGTAFFSNLKGSKHKIKLWKEKRLYTYKGSDMHFLRAVITDKVKEEGFTVQRLIRKPNPAYKGGFDNKFIQTLVTTPLPTELYKHLTDQKDEYALQFDDYLDVIYDNNPMSYSIINIQAKCAFFDNNGIILNPENVWMEGAWGDRRIAEMLPVDYEPAE